MVQLKDPEEASMTQSLLMNALQVQESKTHEILHLLLDVHRENSDRSQEIFECGENLRFGFPFSKGLEFEPKLTREARERKDNDQLRELVWGGNDNKSDKTKLYEMAKRNVVNKSMAFQRAVTGKLKETDSDILRLSLHQLLELPRYKSFFQK